MLEGRISTQPRWQARFTGTGRFRVPLDVADPTAGGGVAAASWVVVAAGGLPVARLWRPGTGGDDLPPAPWIDARNCVVTVRSKGNAETVAGAVVVPIPAAAQRQFDDEIGWSGFSWPGHSGATIAGVPGWRPWLVAAVSSPAGQAVVRVPADMDTTIRVHVRGYAAGEAICRGGAATPAASVALQRVAAWSDFVLVSASGDRLVGALVRSGDGWPMALSDAKAQVTLPDSTRDWWVEEDGGRIHSATADERIGALRLTLVSVRRQGRIALRPALPNRSAARRRQEPAERAIYWIHPAVRPWSGLHHDMAPAQFAATSRPSGEFDVDLLDGDRLWFSQPGYSHDACRLQRKNDTDCPVLVAARLIRGRVVDEAGEPLADVEIDLSRIRTRRGAPDLRQFLRSGSDGTFESDRFPPATGIFDHVAVAIDQPGFLPIRSPGIERSMDRLGEHVIVLKRGVVVRGVVLDRDTGAPVQGAEVGLGPFGRNGAVAVLGELSGLRVSGIFTTRANEKGAFALRVPSGRFDLAVKSPRHGFLLEKGVRVETADLDLGAILLDPGQDFVGVVIDQEARPVAGASVTASVTATPDALGRAVVSGFGDSTRLRTGDDGFFRIPGLDPSMRLNLTVLAPDFAVRRFEGVEFHSREPFEVRLAPGAVLAVRATRGGEPASGTFELSGSSQRHAPGLLSSDRSHVAAGRIPDDGRFVIRSLVADRYRLLVRTSNGSERRMTVKLDQGEERSIDVEFESGAGSVVGRATSRRRGLPGVEIELGDIARALTDSAGRFAFDDVPTGTFALTATSMDGVVSKEKTIRMRGGEVQVDFDLGLYRIRGRAILENDAAAAEGAALSFSSPWIARSERADSSTGITVSVGAGGRFDVTLGHGYYDVELNVDGRRLAALNGFEVQGDAADAVVRFQGMRAGRIVGRVHGPSRSEARSLRVEAVNRDLDLREADVDSDGNFVLEDVPYGEWTIVGTLGESNRRTTHRVQVGDAEVHADLVFVPGHDLEGVVLLDGAPWVAAQVLLMRDGEWDSARRLFTRHDGSFAFRGLDPGQHRLAVGTEIRTVRIPEDRQIHMRLRGGRFLGRVLDEPAAGIGVVLWPAAARRQEAEALGLVWTSWTDESRKFDFGRMPSGDWMVEVEGRPDTRRRILLPPGGRVETTFQ